ncbi:MAG: GDP-mannose 4,6-dehydratase [archaeon]
MTDNYWKNKRVLVTGADGFMGSHLCEKLIELGANVSVFVRYVSHPPVEDLFLRNVGHIQHKFEHIIRGNIGSPEANKLIRQNKPEIIFHLAADAYVPHSFTNPVEVIESNIMGTLNVLEAARELDTERVVCTSSSEMYGPCDGPIHEEYPLYPTSPYAASKLAGDRLAYAYFNTYNLPIAIIRPFNTYGPRHTYDVIPKFIKLALENKPLTVYGDGKQTRDLSYVTDMITAFLIMGSHKKAIGEAVNFGTGQDIRIQDVAEKIIKYTGSTSPIIHVQPRLSEVSKLLVDYSKAKKLFGWEPNVFIDEGIQLNIEWAKKNKAAATRTNNVIL